jgi:hypothetical protein
MRYITMMSMVAALLVGCGKKGDSIANKVGEAIGQQATDFTKGVGKGIDQKIGDQMDSAMVKQYQIGL